MATGTVLHLPHLGEYSVHVSLFKDVENAAFLRQQLILGNTDFEYAFLDASKILSVNHALAAVFRAINDMLHTRLKSRNVHSEVVFSLNPNNNIADAFRQFGVSDSTTNLLAIKVVPRSVENTGQLEPSSHLATNIQGTRIEFNDKNLAQTVDLPQIRKLYKLDHAATINNRKKKPGKNAQTDEHSSARQTNGVHSESHNALEMEAVILGIMALKGS